MTRWLARAVLVGALLGGAPGAGRAEEGPAGAPLQESKQALRELEKEKARGERPAESLRGALPRLAAPDTGEPAARPAPPPGDTPAASGREGGSSLDNWLLNGMRGLEDNSGRKDRDRERDDDKDELDPAAPDYLLQSFIREKRRLEELEKRRSTQGGSTTSGTIDPMAPFMTDWLHRSTKQLASPAPTPREQTEGRGYTAPAVTNTVDSGLLGSRPELQGVLSDPLVPGVGKRNAERSNPYLAGLGPAPSTTLPGRSSSGSRTPGSMPSAAASQTPAAPLVPVPSAPPTVVSPDRKAPASPLLENEKYFPQQRKF